MGNCKSKNNQLHVIEHGFDATNPSKSAFRYDKSSKQIFFVGDESTAILTGSSESICSFGGSGIEEQYAILNQYYQRKNRIMKEVCLKILWSILKMMMRALFKHKQRARKVAPIQMARPTQELQPTMYLKQTKENPWTIVSSVSTWRKT